MGIVTKPNEVNINRKLFNDSYILMINNLGA